MRNKLKVLMGTAVFALGLAVVPASWANSLTFQNVTFDINAVDSNTVNLTITNADNANGDWLGINGFAAFELKTIGSVSGLTLSGWSVFDDSLDANGCANGNTSGGCFVYTAGSGSPLAIAHVMSFDIDFTGTLDLTNPHLKVLFTTNGEIDVPCIVTRGNHTDTLDSCVSGKTGTLLSQDVPGRNVPEPASLLLLGAGLAGLGIWRRKSV